MERTEPVDVIGLDRLGRSLLRVIARSEASSVVAVHGAPGSGKSEFFRRLAWLTHTARARNEPIPGIHGSVVWFDPWSWSKQGNLMSGIVAAVVRASTRPPALIERAREVVSHANRLRLDGRVDAPGAAFSGADMDPVEALADGFATLVAAAKENRAGRLLIFVDNVDRLSPELRWQLFDGLRLMMSGGADATAVLCVGREAALAAVAWHEGDIPEGSALRVLEDIFDLALTVPALDVRRIGGLLRDYLGPSEAVVRRSFGEASLQVLGTAVAHRPLGAPRFLRHLALRVMLLAEYAADARVSRELTEAQWAWVVLSERWPRFRRFMVTGGRLRWDELRRWLDSSQRVPSGRLPPGVGNLDQWLDEDRLLADYLALHAPALVEEADGVFWLENLLLAAGL